MLKMQNLINSTHQAVLPRNDILHKHLLVFCNISARLSRYLVDKRAATARYSRKLMCNSPVTLIHS
jgi:hypothetical protein